LYGRFQCMKLILVSAMQQLFAIFSRVHIAA
jgi:hypothetical protein